jgi:hypothetical protein
MIGSATHLLVIPEAERSEAVRNPVFQGADYWIPGIGGLRPPFLELKNADAKRRLPLRGSRE